MELTFYAIRLVGTDMYLPEVGRSYTNYEPMANWYRGISHPRLFYNRISAVFALKRWKQGKWRNDHEDGLVVKTVPHRKNMELEIVQLKLSEFQPTNGESDDTIEHDSLV